MTGSCSDGGVTQGLEVGPAVPVSVACELGAVRLLLAVEAAGELTVRQVAGRPPGLPRGVAAADDHLLLTSSAGLRFADARISMPAPDGPPADQGPVLLYAADGRVVDVTTRSDGVTVTGAVPAPGALVVARARVDRVAGADRYGTAAAVADLTAAALGDPVVAYVATGADWPDALAAGPSAAREGAPLLLVDGADLDESPPTRDHLLRRRAELDRIVVVGGRATVMDSTLEELLVGPGETYDEAATDDGTAAVRLRVLDARRFVLDNPGEVDLEHGVAYTLERLTDAGWEPANPDAVFTDQALLLPVGATSEELGVSEQEPGRYRLTVDAWPSGFTFSDDDRLTVRAEFTVPG